MDPDWSPASNSGSGSGKNEYGSTTLELFTKKFPLSSQKYGFGIRGPEKNLFRIPDPGLKKAPDPGSGSATMQAGKPVMKKTSMFKPIG